MSWHKVQGPENRHWRRWARSNDWARLGGKPPKVGRGAAKRLAKRYKRRSCKVNGYRPASR